MCNTCKVPQDPNDFWTTTKLRIDGSAHVYVHPRCKHCHKLARIAHEAVRAADLARLRAQLGITSPKARYHKPEIDIENHSQLHSTVES